MKKLVLLVCILSALLLVCCKEEPHVHTFSTEWSSDDDYHWHATTCGHDDVSDKAGHLWDEGVVTREATHTEDGVKTYTCTICGKTKTEAIPASADAHSYEWAYDADYHWHVATCGHDVVSEKAEHVLDENGKCTECPFDEIEKLFDITPEGTLSVKDGCKAELPGVLSIPASIFGTEVKAIGERAFEECTGLTSITIPDSVTSIDPDAFVGCTGIKNISFSGTKTEWKELSDGLNWAENIPATVVHCSDGNVRIRSGVMCYDGNEVTISFYHNLYANQYDVLYKYIKEFNKLYPDIHIAVTQMADVDELKRQIRTEIAIGDQPNIAFCYPDHVALYNMAGAVVTLDNLIDSTIVQTRADGTTETLGLTAEQKADFIEGFYDEGKQFGDGLMYTMPLSKSTDVLYYDKTFFDVNGIKVPTTWEEMEQVCAQIKAIDPYSIPLGYDSESNWFITMCEQYNSPYTSANEPHYLFNNEQNIAFVKMLGDWYQKGYLTTQKLYGAYTYGLFTSTTGGVTSYMSIASSTHAIYHRPEKGTDGTYPFEVGIATIPQVSESDRKVISQGPSLCIFDKDDPQEVMASWLFVKYLTTTVGFQAEFGMASGYVPVIKSVAQNEVYADFLASADGGDNIAALSAKTCMEQQDAYFALPAFNGCSDVGDEVGNLLARCLTNPSDDAIAGYFQKAIEGEPLTVCIDTALDAAAGYIRLMYDTSSAADPAPKTPDDYYVVDLVTIDGVSYSVEWTADTDYITFEKRDNHRILVKMPDENPKMNYNLTATVMDKSGSSKSIQIPHSLSMRTADPTYEEIVEMAFELPEGGTLRGSYVLYGKVIAIPVPYSELYGNITVNIQVGDLDHIIQCYRLSGDGCEKIEEGDCIAVEGEIKNYKGTIEFYKPVFLGFDDPSAEQPGT